MRCHTQTVRLGDMWQVWSGRQTPSPSSFESPTRHIMRRSKIKVVLTQRSSHSLTTHEPSVSATTVGLTASPAVTVLIGIIVIPIGIASV